MEITLYIERLAQAMDVLSQTTSEIASILRDAQSAANAEETKAIAKPKVPKQSKQASQSRQETNPSGKDLSDTSDKVTVEDVRAVLAEKSQDGLTAKVRELLESFDANKLSAVDPARLPDLLEAAKALK